MWTRLAVLTVLALTSSVHAGTPLIELKGAGGETWQGKSIAHDAETCWLEQTDGQVHKLDLRQVVDFRKVGIDFRSASPADLKAQLTTEFGRNYEVRTLGRYLVVAPPGKARKYSELLDSVYRGYWQFFSRRSFGLKEPDYPLVAVVFKTQAEFARYGASLRMNVSATLKGFYDPFSNRLAFFEESGVTISQSPILPDASWGAASTDGNNTLIHEAVHQLAFNTGLHSRTAETPRWLAEGLAMMFEVQLSKDAPAGPRGGKINSERLTWFKRSLSGRRHTIQQLVSSEQKIFQASVLDAYSEAWGLSYFLSETRPSEFARYLKVVAAREPLKPYSPEERLKDFQDCFGTDVARLEVEFLRFLDTL